MTTTNSETRALERELKDAMNHLDKYPLIHCLYHKKSVILEAIIKNSPKYKYDDDKNREHIKYHIWHEHSAFIGDGCYVFYIALPLDKQSQFIIAREIAEVFGTNFTIVQREADGEEYLTMRYANNMVSAF